MQNLSGLTLVVSRREEAIGFAYIDHVMRNALSLFACRFGGADVQMTKNLD